VSLWVYVLYKVLIWSFSRLEDTITFHLIERVQFPLNKGVYTAGATSIPDAPHMSLLDYMLSQTERVHSLLRRYESPDEYPFFPDSLAKPILKPLSYPTILHPNNVNVNDQIKDGYTGTVLPTTCRDFGRADRGEREENYGSAATCDVACLQALSRRIHFGKFVAESKFQTETERFVDLIKREDRKGIDEAITNAAVEAKVLERLRLKAKTYGTDPSTPGDESLIKINVDAVVAMYKVESSTRHAFLYADYLTGDSNSSHESCRGRVPHAALAGHQVGKRGSGWHECLSWRFVTEDADGNRLQLLNVVGAARQVIETYDICHAAWPTHPCTNFSRACIVVASPSPAISIMWP
jgi:chorismate mutase